MAPYYYFKHESTAAYLLEQGMNQRTLGGLKAHPHRLSPPPLPQTRKPIRQGLRRLSNTPPLRFRRTALAQRDRVVCVSPINSDAGGQRSCVRQTHSHHPGAQGVEDANRNTHRFEPGERLIEELSSLDGAASEYSFGSKRTAFARNSRLIRSLSNRDLIRGESGAYFFAPDCCSSEFSTTRLRRSYPSRLSSAGPWKTLPEYL